MLSIQKEILQFLTNLFPIILTLVIFSIVFKKRKLMYGLLVILYIVSSPALYKILLYYLEKPYFNCTDQSKKADVVVILGGGGIGKKNLRIKYGVLVHKKYHIPILVSGGGSSNPKYSEAAVMKRFIENEYNARVTYVESKSRTTSENAKFVSKIIKKNKIRSLLIVSDSWHLKRASFLFRKYNPGVKIYACSGHYYSDKNLSFHFKDFLPSISLQPPYLHRTVLREWILLFWYTYINTSPSRTLY